MKMELLEGSETSAAANL